MYRLAPSEGDRHSYVHNGQVIYQWDQTLRYVAAVGVWRHFITCVSFLTRVPRSDVNIYIQVPAGTRGKQLTVQITTQHLLVGIQDNPPYLDVCLCDLSLPGVRLKIISFHVCMCVLLLQKDLGGPVKVSDALWTLGVFFPPTFQRLSFFSFVYSFTMNKLFICI